MSELDTFLKQLEKIDFTKLTRGLSRCKAVADRLNLLSVNVPVVTVAGTNGKGTTVALISNILQASGLKVATYTSPHLLSFNERVAVDLVSATDELILAALYRVKQASDGVELSYFEYAFLAALLIFKQANCEVLVLEVGLGGKLDATNIVDTDVAIITTVDLDHTHLLGNDRATIALEKAGICRRGKPLVYGDIDMPDSLQQKLLDLKCPVCFSNLDGGINLSAYDKAINTAKLAVSLLPKNLFSGSIKFNAGIQQTKLLGRFQKINWHCPVFLDVAHNPQAVRNLAYNLKQQQIVGKVYAVFACMRDKDVKTIAKELNSTVSMWHYIEINSPRAFKSVELSEVLALDNSVVYTDLRTCLLSLGKQVSSKDCIVIFGSFLLVAEALRFFKCG